MTVEFVNSYLETALEKNKKYVICTFYDLRVKQNLSEEEVAEFLLLSKNKLENNGFKVFFTGEQFIYQGIRRKVESNQYMIAYK